MHLSPPLTLPRRRSRSRRSFMSRPAVTPSRERNQRANISEDAALYSCACGYVFKAAVTTSVGCPHCGSDQAW
jgi:Zn finger protein HypA/HybF involved in hydrogenase expression